MARTVKVIYAEMIAEKEKYSSLDDLESTSNTAIWRSVMYVVAVVIAAYEQLQDVYQTNLLEDASKLPTGTNQWYAQQTLLYQEGYNPVYDRETGTVKYEVEDEDARILKVATCENESTNIVVKAIKDDGSGGGEELTTAEYNAVQAYIDSFKFAGPVVNLVSDPGDLLQLSLDIKVKATLINSLGQSVADTSTYPVEEAIENFLLDFQNENFDAELKLMKLVDAVQTVPGVLNVVITTAEAKPYSAASFTNVLGIPLQVYTANAGWFEIDPTHTLNDNITYTV